MNCCELCGLDISPLEYAFLKAGVQSNAMDFHRSFKNYGVDVPCRYIWGCQGIKNDTSPDKQFSFTTIAPSKYLNKKYNPKLPMNENSISDLKKFGDAISFLYDEYIYVVESGKNPKEPKLHIHILGIPSNSKKTKDGLRCKWNQYMKKHMVREMDWKSDDYDLRQWRKSDAMPTYDDWIAEKKSYMYNEYKGTHENYCVLQPSPKGAGGVSTTD